MRALLLLSLPVLVCSSPLPEKPPPPHLQFGGFQPVHRNPGFGGGGGGVHRPLLPPPPPPPTYNEPSGPIYSEPSDPSYSEPIVETYNEPPGPTYIEPAVPSIQTYSDQPPQTYNEPPHIQGPSSGPTKTIYVNVPAVESPPLPPVAAGPPRKHYKIVFIRAPTPPRTQTVLPPRTEQKTVIYVLHQRPEEQEQRVVQIPHIPHDPEVYFVEYDKEPSAYDLQQLSSGNLDGFSVTQQEIVDNEEYGAPAIQEVTHDAGPYNGDSIFKRQVGKKVTVAAASDDRVHPPSRVAASDDRVHPIPASRQRSPHTQT